MGKTRVTTHRQHSSVLRGLTLNVAVVVSAVMVAAAVVGLVKNVLVPVVKILLLVANASRSLHSANASPRYVMLSVHYIDLQPLFFVYNHRPRSLC